jgi:hypothetical protein
MGTIRMKLLSNPHIPPPWIMKPLMMLNMEQDKDLVRAHILVDRPQSTTVETRYR